MIITKARTHGKKCNGFKGCGDNIYIGFEYYKLRGRKYLCKACGDKFKLKGNVMDAKTKKLKPELKPIDEFFIAITTTDGSTVKGWYDFNDKSYCDVNETLIEISTIVTWDKWPIAEGELS